MIEKCTICPHKCNIDRKIDKGRCKAGDKIEIRGSKSSQIRRAMYKF